MIMQLFSAVIMLMALLHASSAPAAAAARVAVLPFEIYSDESSKPLKDIIAGDLSARLASDNRLEVVDQARVREAMADRASLTFNETTLLTISGKLDAPFLVIGSMTRIGANISLDTYIFKADGTPSFTKEFSEGKNLDTITSEMAAKVNARIVKLAPAPREEAVPQEKVAAVPPAADRPEKPLQEENLPNAAVEADAGEAAEEPGAAAAKHPAAPAAEETPREPAPVVASLRPEEAAAESSPGKEGKEDRKEITLRARRRRCRRSRPASGRHPYARSDPDGDREALTLPRRLALRRVLKSGAFLAASLRRCRRFHKLGGAAKPAPWDDVRRRRMAAELGLVDRFQLEREAAASASLGRQCARPGASRQSLGGELQCAG